MDSFTVLLMFVGTLYVSVLIGIFVASIIEAILNK